MNLRRLRTYWLMNWDRWLILALTFGGFLSAIGDTIRHNRIGY